MTALLLLAACPVLDPQPGAPGQTAAVRIPAPAALALNNEGKALYRQGEWEKARAKYRAAQAADPEFLAPALNVACAFARQERLAEATREALALIRRGFVPWGREVMEAADLAVLHVRPEMAQLRSAFAEAAAGWGESLREALLFVARTGPPVRASGAGVRVLALHQEIFAWLPSSGRYRQVTAEDGRVLAFARSPDGRRVIYLRAGKLVRAPGAPPVLRELTLRQLDLPTMSLGPPVDLPGDLVRVELSCGLSSTELRLSRADRTDAAFSFDGQGLRPTARLRIARPIVLTANGVERPARIAGPTACPFTASDEPPASVRIRTRAGARMLATPYGAGLVGLPLP